MKLSYQVHSVAEDKAQIIAQVGGKDREVTTDVLTVELTAPGSALTFRFEEADEARKLFETGKPVTLSFAKGK